MEENKNCYYITHRKTFQAQNISAKDVLIPVFDFAYNMSFGQAGEHRDHRTGGQHRRRNGEIFINTLQGKLAEFVFHNSVRELGIELNEPDLAEWELGEWDPFDFVTQGKHIAVKSTKHFGNLLLLETGDWNKNGSYIPNLETGCSDYDFIVLVRLSPDGESLMRQNRLYYSDTCERQTLHNIITQQNWQFDIPGFITRNELANEIINGTPPLILAQN